MGGTSGKGGGARKIGRTQAKCASYRARRKREHNKVTHLRSLIKKAESKDRRKQAKGLNPDKTVETLKKHLDAANKQLVGTYK